MRGMLRRATSRLASLPCITSVGDSAACFALALSDIGNLSERAFDRGEAPLKEELARVARLRCRAQSARNIFNIFRFGEKLPFYSSEAIIFSKLSALRKITFAVSTLVGVDALIDPHDLHEFTRVDVGIDPYYLC